MNDQAFYEAVTEYLEEQAFHDLPARPVEHQDDGHDGSTCD